MGTMKVQTTTTGAKVKKPVVSLFPEIISNSKAKNMAMLTKGLGINKTVCKPDEHLGNAPWDIDKIHFSDQVRTDEWCLVNGESPKYWDTNQYLKYDLSSWIANFYMLEAMSSLILANEYIPQSVKLWKDPYKIVQWNNRHNIVQYSENLESLEEISLVSIILLATISQTMASCMRNYFNYALGRELKYHPKAWYLGTTKESITAGWFKLHEMYGEEQCLEWAKEVYSETRLLTISPDRTMDENVWSDVFGGKPWAEIAEFMLTKEYNGKKLNDIQFVDRCFNMQHNSGCALNKVRWKQYSNAIDYCLPAHSSGNYMVLYYFCSSYVQTLVKRYMMYVNDYTDTEIKLKDCFDYIDPSIRNMTYNICPGDKIVCSINNYQLKEHEFYYKTETGDVIAEQSWLDYIYNSGFSRDINHPMWKVDI